MMRKKSMIKINNGEDEKEKGRSKSAREKIKKRNDDENQQWIKLKRAVTIKISNGGDDKET
jgi:hypothetical protein